MITPCWVKCQKHFSRNIQRAFGPKRQSPGWPNQPVQQLWERQRKSAASTFLLAIDQSGDGVARLCYSHSMVPGGLDVMSYTTRLMPRTSFTIRVEIALRTSYGSGTQSAVMPSSECTARIAQV